MKSVLLILSFSLYASEFIPKQFEAEIEQVVKKRRLSKRKPRVETLNLKYKYPQNIIMSTKNTTIVCNSNMTWIYTPAIVDGQKGTVNIDKSKDICFSSILDSLKYGLKTNKEYVVTKNIKESSIELKFKNKNFKSIVLTFEKALNKKLTLKDVIQMKIVENNGKYKVLNIKKVSTNVRYSDADFVFKIPKNTNRI